ncbi:MAG: sugar ABC transporter ATP-binding protein [Chloroflexi bacterium]|nr:sugar ABC transporter ATP-binding protein [Chloroflexota bacterium]
MTQSLVEMRGITMRFPGVTALDGVDFESRAGEVHAVVGENGAGKSTLMKILAGVYQPDCGEIVLRGQPVRISSPHEAQLLGISIIYQELNLLPDLTVAENVFLGREPRGKFGLIDSRALELGAREVLHRLGVDIDPRQRLGRLSVAQQQMVEIAKALSLNAQIVIMDEPSAALGGRDLDKLFEVIAALKKNNVAVIYISHRLAEVFQVADRVTVFKDGKVVGTHTVSEIDRPSLVRMMIGRTLSETFPPRGKQVGEEILRVEGLRCGDKLTRASLSVRRGEIVGIAGLVGSGRTELAQAIFGARRIDGGEVRIRGQKVSFDSPRDGLHHKLGFLTEDRNLEGLVMGLSVRENAALPSLDRRQHFGFVDSNAEGKVVAEMTENLRVRTPSLGQEVENLSGGTRQKVVLAKWLISGAELLIFDEPTRGIDVGAKAEIWQLMRDLANQGKAILMISSEIPEIVGISDRIVVMHRGCMVGELAGETATEEKVMMLATYGESHGE